MQKHDNIMVEVRSDGEAISALFDKGAAGFALVAVVAEENRKLLFFTRPTGEPV